MQDSSSDYSMLRVYWDDTRTPSARANIFSHPWTSVDKKTRIKKARNDQTVQKCADKTLRPHWRSYPIRIPVVIWMGQIDLSMTVACYTTPRRRRRWAAYTGHEGWLTQTQKTKRKPKRRERGTATASLEDSEHNDTREIHSPLSQHFSPTGQSVSNLQSLATSQFSRQVPLQQLDFLPAWSHAVLLKQGIAQVPNRIIKLNVNVATKFFRLYILMLFCNKTQSVKTSHFYQPLSLATLTSSLSLHSWQYFLTTWSGRKLP